MKRSSLAFTLCCVGLAGCSSSGRSDDDGGVNDATSMTDATTTDVGTHETSVDAHDTSTTDASRDAAVSADAATPDTNIFETSVGAPPETTSDAGSTGQWVLGYYVGYDIHDYKIPEIDWTGLTHIVFSPMVVNSDLSLDLSFSDDMGTGEADAKAISTAAHAHGVKALLMLGGENAGPNIATAASAPNRAAFVAALTDAVATLG